MTFTEKLRAFGQSLLSRKFLLTVAAVVAAVDSGETLGGIAVAALYVLAEGAGDVVERRERARSEV